MKRNKITTITLLFIILLCIPFTSAQDISGLDVSLLEYSPQPVQPGQVMDVYLQVVNTGNPTKDSSVKIIEEYPFILEQSQDLENAKHLGPVSTRRILQFRVRIADDVKDGIVPLRVQYTPETSVDSFIEKNVDINIQTFDARLDIVKVEQVPQEIVPGETGKLILTLENNDDQPLENIDVVLDLTNSYNVNTNMDNMIAMQSMVNARLEEVNRRVASGISPLKGATPMMNTMDPEQNTQPTKFEVFAPVGTSNQKRVAVLNARETKKVVFEIKALPDVTPTIYAVPLYINYNDEDNNPFHVRVDVPITVNMEPELYVELEKSTLRTTDFSGNVVFTIANRGLSDLRYATLTLEDHATIKLLTAPKSIYLGNLDPGQSKTGNFTILAHDTNITLPISVSYRDSFNKEHNAFKFIPYQIINKNYYRDLPYEMWLAWIILGVVILVLTIFYIVNITKKKQ